MSARENASDARPTRERPPTAQGRTPAFGRGLLLFAFLLTLAAPLSAEAYTLVLRSGRRVEISDKFDVTREALIHEVAPGVRVAVRLEHIDIEATERANNEPAGTFLARAARAPVQTPEVPRPTASPRVVTNKDLESFRRERLRREADYERLRAERGLPSMEELRRRDEERDRKFIEEARRIEAEQRRAAEYEALRGELLSLRAQVGAVYAQPAYAPSVVYYPTAAFPVLPQLFPGFGRHGIFPRRHFGGHTFGRPQGFWPQPFFGHRPAGRASIFLRFGTRPTGGSAGRGPSRR